MNIIIGLVVVLASVLGGYALAHGNFSVLIQPAEYIVILGAAIGSLIIGNPPQVIKRGISSTLAAMSGKGYQRSDYTELLLAFNDLTGLIRREGLLAIEKEVENPHESTIFKKYPKLLHDHEAFTILTDNLRMIIGGGVDPMQLENLLEVQIESAFEEAMEPAHAIQNMADGIPGLGIVAAVQGVIITMGFLAEPPEIIGHHVAAALVGTFLGVLVCYGFVGPIARALEGKAKELRAYLNVLKVLLLSTAEGASPQITREKGRVNIPGDFRPSSEELEKMIR